MTADEQGRGSPSNRLRFAELVQAALFDTVGEGLLLTSDGRVEAINRIGAQLLSVDRQVAVGARVDALWPQLARVVDSQTPALDEPLSVASKNLLFTVRYVGEDRQRLAVVRVVEAAAVERRAETVIRAIDFSGMIGGSPSIVAVRKLAQIAAQSNSSVLVEGESGAGKEVVAQAIHSLGPRKAAPFVAVHCAAIPADLLESELFGHDAAPLPAQIVAAARQVRGRRGRHPLARRRRGLPLHMQAKLLRVLQERTVVRLGSSRSRRIDVHVVATSNQRLRAAVDAGRFRADLFYRLNVVHIVIPPLRDRAGGHRSSGRALPAQVREGARRALCRRSRARRCARCTPTPGPATCASSSTGSRVRFTSRHRGRRASSA